MSDVHLRPIEPLIAIILARLCGSAPAIAALLGRFLPRLGPLVATQAAFLFVCPPSFSGSFGVKSKVPGVALPKSHGRGKSPRLHFFVGFRAYCGCGISSSPPCLRLLSVTESVALPPDPWGVHHMPECHSPRMIERSRCPKCEIRMMLVGVECSVVGPDLRAPTRSSNSSILLRCTLSLTGT
jgi:hypothetical protein